METPSEGGEEDERRLLRDVDNFVRELLAEIPLEILQRAIQASTSNQSLLSDDRTDASHASRKQLEDTAVPYMVDFLTKRAILVQMLQGVWEASEAGTATAQQAAEHDAIIEERVAELGESGSALLTAMGPRFVGPAGGVLLYGTLQEDGAWPAHTAVERAGELVAALRRRADEQPSPASPAVPRALMRGIADGAKARLDDAAGLTARRSKAQGPREGRERAAIQAEMRRVAKHAGPLCVLPASFAPPKEVPSPSRRWLEREPVGREAARRAMAASPPEPVSRHLEFGKGGMAGPLGYTNRDLLERMREWREGGAREQEAVAARAAAIDGDGTAAAPAPPPEQPPPSSERASRLSQISNRLAAQGWSPWRRDSQRCVLGYGPVDAYKYIIRQENTVWAKRKQLAELAATEAQAKAAAAAAGLPGVVSVPKPDPFACGRLLRHGRVVSRPAPDLL